MQGKNQFELDKMATLMGVAGARTSAAAQSLAQQQQNLITLQGQQTQMWGQAVGATDWEAIGNSFNSDGSSSNTYNTGYNTGYDTGDYYTPPPGLS